MKSSFINKYVHNIRISTISKERMPHKLSFYEKYDYEDKLENPEGFRLEFDNNVLRCKNFHKIAKTFENEILVRNFYL